ncbi:hypothetical protein SAZ10_15700 [Mesorhizobium sp. BAC0120]|uniref:hypothetical protein n=1 Tax=Mesorhizobium sp. BAC0120 TaxID=3090670 RepID=UPI00298BDDEA|nr:hypothetical protein [Mesorhizobium sp. BAC0120]MDW6023202.1 hypothetical protein [Mesorhizobium sp. BAC0120]
MAGYGTVTALRTGLRPMAAQQSDASNFVENALPVSTLIEGILAPAANSRQPLAILAHDLGGHWHRRARIASSDEASE